MTRTCLVAIAAICVMAAPAGAHTPPRDRSSLLQQAIAAVDRMPLADVASRGQDDGWSALRRHEGQEIVIHATGLPAGRYRLLRATDQTLTLRPLDGDRRPDVPVDRGAVEDVVLMARTRGSILGAVLGAGGGFALAIVTDINLALKQCGASCADERFLIGASLIGMPLAGGLLGYQVGRQPEARTIYRRP